MTQYRFEVEKPFGQENEISIKISKKFYSFWLGIGKFKIIDKKLMVLTKTENWEEFSDVSEDAHLFSLPLEKLPRFYRIILETMKLEDCWETVERESLFSISSPIKVQTFTLTLSFSEEKEKEEKVNELDTQKGDA